MLTPLSPALAELPAISVAVPLVLCCAPSTSVAGAGQAAMPGRLAWQVKLTTTLALYQPFAFATRSAAAAIVGRVLSILMLLTMMDDVLPAKSEAVPPTV